MNKYYKIGETEEVAVSEEEAKAIEDQYLRQMKIPVKCKGELTFEDHRIASGNFYYLTTEVKNGIFYVPDENADNPVNFDIHYSNDTTFILNFHRFFPEKDLNENMETVKKVFESSIYGNVLLETGNSITGIDKNIFEKPKPDTLKEVKISGNITFMDHQVAKENYLYLVKEVKNTIFYNPSEIHFNILCDIDVLHFHCHRFFTINYIDENIDAIKKLVESSKKANVIFEIVNSETEVKSYVFKK